MASPLQGRSKSRRRMGGHPREVGESCCPWKVRDAGSVQGFRAHGNTAQLGSFSASSSPLTVELSPWLGLGAGMGDPAASLVHQCKRSQAHVLSLGQCQGRGWSSPVLIETWGSSSCHRGGEDGESQGGTVGVCLQPGDPPPP